MEIQRKIKILYVITKSNFGGAQRYVFELATHFHTQGYLVHVACGGSGTLVEKLETAGITVHRIKNFERDINIQKELSSLKELHSLIASLRPDIVHLNSSKAGGSGALIARLCRVPKIIFTAHGWPFFEKRSMLARSIIWLFSYITVILAHATIVVSEHDMNRAHMPFVRKKLAHIPTSVSHIPFLSRDVARKKLFTHEHIHTHKNDLWFVSIGEYTYNKNFLFLIEGIRAYNSTHDRKIFLTLMGTGELSGTLETEITRLGLSSHITLLGYIENARVYLPAFDAFVLPSIKEGLPYVLLEAGLAGLHCSASNVGGIPEILSDASLGFLFDPTQQSSLGRALEKTVTRIAESQTNALLQEKIKTVYAQETMFKKTRTVYNQK